MRFLLFALSVFFIFTSCQEKVYQRNEGKIFGTYYHLTYASQVDLGDEVKMVLDSFSSSLSTYDTLSIISRINQNKEFKTDSFFRAVFRRSAEISLLTDGAFDITIAPLVNVWGFGFSEKVAINDYLIDSLLAFVGMDKVRLHNEILQKERPGVMLDASAIAKGYSVDVVADYLKKNGVVDFMVEIGGEVVTSGLNPKGARWKLGVDDPVDDPLLFSRDFQMVVALSDGALATSGNYRNYYIKDGKKYAHTIDPKTGYPVDHNLLSASIIARDCMSADAFATACMVIGIEESMQLIESLPDLEGYFIAHTDSGNQISMTSGFHKFIAN